MSKRPPALVAVALVALAVPCALAGWPARAAAQDAAAACAAPRVSDLWAAVPEAEREGFVVEPPADEDARPGPPPRVVAVELDGAASSEALLGLDALGEGGEPGQSAVWAFACRGGGWASLGRLLFPIDDAWDGTYDTVPGLQVLRAETLPGLAHALVRIEHVDVRGGYDPRFVRRRFVYAHLVGGVLTTALDLVVRESSEAGPEREEVYAATRTLVLDRRARPPAFRLVVSTTEEGRSRGCRTRLVFDGRAFVPADAACAAR